MPLLDISGVFTSHSITGLSPLTHLTMGSVSAVGLMAPSSSSGMVERGLVMPICCWG